MKKKRYKIGTISDKELKKKVRKQLPPPGNRHRSEREYRRKEKHKSDLQSE